METLLLTTEKQDIEKAAEVIREGGLAAFPTETVYGLGADALNRDAVRKIYEAKGRPADNPTIAHISSIDDMKRLTPVITEEMKLLADAFWPGPLTMVVPRLPEVPDTTTGGLDTVGIRMPQHPAARELIRLAGTPIAAPSANISGRPSPTTAEDVLEDMAGRIDCVIDGGPSTGGIESTVLDLSGETPMILRPGLITKKDLEAVLGGQVLLDPTLNKKPEAGEDFRPKAPGMKYRHYAPKADMLIFEGEDEKVSRAIAEKKSELEREGRKVVVLEYQAEREAARHFFAALRKADRDGADMILTRGLPEEGIGFSVMNRMLKSAGFRVIKV